MKVKKRIVSFYPKGQKNRAGQIAKGLSWDKNKTIKRLHYTASGGCILSDRTKRLKHKKYWGSEGIYKLALAKEDSEEH